MKLSASGSCSNVFKDVDQLRAEPDEVVGVFSGTELGKTEILGDLGVGKRLDQRGGCGGVHGCVFGVGVFVIDDVGSPAAGKPKSAHGIGFADESVTEVNFLALVISSEDKIQTNTDEMEQAQVVVSDEHRFSPILRWAYETPGF